MDFAIVLGGPNRVLCESAIRTPIKYSCICSLGRYIQTKSWPLKRLFPILFSNLPQQTHEEYLFNPDLLKNLDWSSVKGQLSPPITNEDPGEPWLLVRPLKITDFDNGYLQILTQLTTVGDVSRSMFERQFNNMKNAGGYYITVFEDTRSGRIIGASTLVTEFKMIHECGLRARLEDVVVNNTYRGKQLGKLIVLTVSLLAKKLGCYKMSLDCKDNLIPFYKSIGYKLEPGNANSMIIRYDEQSSKTQQDPS